MQRPPLLLLMLVAACRFAETYAEEFFQLRGRQDSLRYRGSHVDNHNIITSQEKAEEVLKRYGYLQCGSRRRRNRHRGRSGGGGDGSRDHEDASSSSSPRWSCSAHELRRAVRQYQRNYNMPETGLLDEPTLRVMSEARCGNPDIEAGTLPHRKAKAKRRKHERRKQHRRGKRQTQQAPSAEAVVYGRPAHSTLNGRDTAPAASLESAMARRRRWLREYARRIETGQLQRRFFHMHKIVQLRRRSKRSTTTGTESHVFAKDVVTWRLIGSAYSNQLAETTQRAALALAFRMWGEVIPLVFEEDLQSAVNDVDILVAFGRGEHMNCQNNFDGYGGQLSHLVRIAGSAEIHVDDDEQLTVASEQGTNLVKVAVHEVGHALGLYHTPRNYSIMYAIYSPAVPNSNFELGKEDRRMAQEIYGTCKVRFDTVFDWVRQRPDGHFIYNTYFFRGDRKSVV